MYDTFIERARDVFQHVWIFTNRDYVCMVHCSQVYKTNYSKRNSMLRAARTILGTNPPACNRIICQCLQVPPDQRDQFWWNIYQACYNNTPPEMAPIIPSTLSHQMIPSTDSESISLGRSLISPTRPNNSVDAFSHLSRTSSHLSHTSE